MKDISLTENQQKVVQSKSRKIVVFAGAGTGKTRVITERICRLIIEDKVAPGSILAVTFTTKAAGEMRKRLAQRIGVKSVPIWIKTFHALGLQIIRTFPESISLSPDFEIIDNRTRNGIIRQVLRKHSDPYLTEEEASQIIHKIKNGILSEDTYQGLFDEYCNLLYSKNTVDMDDLVWLAVKILQTHPNIQKQFQSRFTHILIDEYQDINPIQYQMINHLVSPSTCICVVGDDDQCIYEWRGSKPELIREFAHDQTAERIFLSENFRSSAVILQVANSFIAHNSNRVPKEMNPVKPFGKEPVVVRLESEEQQAVLSQMRLKN